MQDNQRQHSGIDTAKRIVSAARIAKAAAAGGVHGAAVAAAKEAAPFLAKLAIWVLAALIALPMLIFAYLPNIFFGFSSSGTAPVARMTGQAMTLGGFYMDLEDFENTQIDAIVTSLIQQYEEEGIEIDGVEINSDFDEDDLRRFIAISSVAYQQDLEVMTTEAVLSLATSRLRYEPTLNIFEFGGLLKRTLVIKIDHLDPEAFMNQLSFEEDARTWAGALYEVLTESNALEEYAEYYAPYRPNYSGDTGYTGDYEHGGSYSDTIDTSGFVTPSTKNNVDLAAYAMQAWENNWGYCWGTYGNVLTEALFNYKLQQYPEGVGKYEDFIRANWLGRRTADCIGLIKGYSWTHVTGSIASKRAYITEGPLKGDVASYLDNDALFVCIGGVFALHGLKDTLISLGVTEVVEAMDMDQMSNPQVRRAIQAIRQEVQSIRGIRYSKYVWNPAYKGIDDYYLSRAAAQ